MPAMRGDSVDDPGLAQGTLQTGSAVRTTGKIARRRRPSLRARSAKKVAGGRLVSPVDGRSAQAQPTDTGTLD